MHLNTRLAVVAAAVAASTALVPAPAIAQNHHDILRADLVGSQVTFPPINGVQPGGAPWLIDRGEVRVRDNGRMDVRIEGLVIPNADGTAANPVASINAVLYCGGMAVADSGPQVLTVPEGDARFRVTGLMVPERCEAPTVLISPTAAVGLRYIAFTPAS